MMRFGAALLLVYALAGLVGQVAVSYILWNAQGKHAKVLSVAVMLSVWILAAMAAVLDIVGDWLG